MDSPEVAVAKFAARVSEWALVVSGASLLFAACAFALELSRWFDEGVKLSMSVMPEAKLYGGDLPDDNTYLALTVTNRGTAAIDHQYGALQLSKPSELRVIEAA
jgi:hypothetical protein